MLGKESLVKQSSLKKKKKQPCKFKIQRISFSVVENPNQLTNWPTSQLTKITQEACSTGKNQDLESVWGRCCAFPLCTTEPNVVLSNEPNVIVTNQKTAY